MQVLGDGLNAVAFGFPDRLTCFIEYGVSKQEDLFDSHNLGALLNG